MRAIRVTALDGPRAVQALEVDDPAPDDEQVLIEVHAAGVTFPDVLLTQGRYQLKPEPPFTLGGEVAGVVRSAPDGAAVSVGDRVCALTMFGGFADLALAPAHMVFPIPDDVSFATAAALPINYLTVHFALTHRVQLTEGDVVLVHGAAGGVGTAAIQFARAHGATVIAVASTDAKAELARKAGAQHTVGVDGFRDAVDELTSGHGADIVIDPVGGDRFTDSLRSLATDGRLLVLGFVGGEIPTVKVNRLLLNNTSLIGVVWGQYALARPDYLQQQWRELSPLVASGALAPPIGHEFALADAGEAVALMDERGAVGKVVLTLR
ncbi:NADPH:quinone oxidoreductase family protein [uncultured Jatrophihabitans sp.]|uniref:NADPH:quinone oxidoreductase family protein n=1 Tax=uncultured Jatrophihabitans sp. TaxID=1610747 RepID=UPI0035CACB77